MGENETLARSRRRPAQNASAEVQNIKVKGPRAGADPRPASSKGFELLQNTQQHRWSHVGFCKYHCVHVVWLSRSANGPGFIERGSAYRYDAPLVEFFHGAAQSFGWTAPVTWEVGA